jgi:hypothetical protein
MLEISAIHQLKTHCLLKENQEMEGKLFAFWSKKILVDYSIIS